MQPEYASESAALPSGNDKIWTMLAHLSMLFGLGIVLPLVVYLAMRQESDFVARHAKEALNFHISLVIYILACVPLMFILIGVPLAIAVSIAAVVLAIVAAVKSSQGQCYRYPLTLRFVN